MSAYTDHARELYQRGCNCAQSALGPFCKDLQLEEETALRMAASFGGGIGGMKEMCGALTGSFLALGLARGYGKECTQEDKSAHSKQVQELAARFREEYGWVNCRDLLLRNQLDGSAGEQKPCMKYVLSAVKHLEEMLAQEPEKG